jgi:RNA polymerase sigma-70 factor, ECF subfamily
MTSCKLYLEKGHLVGFRQVSVDSGNLARSFDYEDDCDARLIARAQSGDTAAFNALLEKHYRTVYSFAYKLSGNALEAEDITQDALLRVARSIKQFQSRSKFTTWLYRIVLNASYDMMNKKKEQRMACENYRDQLEDIIRSTRKISEEILAGLAQLTRPEREALVLTVYEDMTHAQAAEVLGCAETTISWRMFRARKKLRKYFEQEAND